MIRHDDLVIVSRNQSVGFIYDPDASLRLRIVVVEKRRITVVDVGAVA